MMNKMILTKLDGCLIEVDLEKIMLMDIIYRKNPIGYVVTKIIFKNLEIIRVTEKITDIIEKMLIDK